MLTIGVRELRRDASRWLARVRAGESVVVTDRGRPIAKMVPLEEPTGYAALVDQGRIAPGPGRSLRDLMRDLDADLPPDTGSSVSEMLAEMRAHER
ncbi:MAG: type II toxin-antitoxin system prevent-host-death family antitoxin [Acidimicrobiia bacterium]